MGYTPMLLVKLEDLEKNSELFISCQSYLPDEETRGGSENRTILETLTILYFEDKKYIVDAFGTKCRAFRPELTQFNLDIREKLEELEIKYVCIN